MKRLVKNNKGIALVISLMTVAVLIILSAGYVTKAILEKNMSDREARSLKAFYAGEAGGNAGLMELDTLINTNMLNTVSATNPSVLSSNAAGYVGSSGIAFLVAYVKNSGTSLLTQSGTQAIYNGVSTSINTTSNYIYKIIITPNGNVTSVSNNPPEWNLPYMYQIQTTGTDGNQTKKFTINGVFSVQVKKDNFARYALFTNTQTLADGTAVWFTGSTNFAGPMFTNGTYNFAYNPSGTFTSLVQQVSSTASFYNNNHPISLNANNNGTIDVPNFENGFSRSAASVTMPSSSAESTMQTEANGGNTYSTNGIYVPTSSGSLTGGIYVKGDASVSMSTDGSDNPVYTITQGSTTNTITVKPTTNQTVVFNNTTHATNTYSGVPDGHDNVGTTTVSGSIQNIGTIIYVNGNITNLGGTIQKNTQMVVAAHNDVVIQNNITYESSTAGSGTVGTVGYVPPSAEGYINLMGLMSWTGNVRVGTSAPSNVNIDATVMAPSGIFTVDNYDTTAVRGIATVLGGVITNNYGAFGTFNTANGQAVSGYGRNFVYDTRMQAEYTPPYFPTLNTFIAVTNDISKRFWQTGGF